MKIKAAHAIVFIYFFLNSFLLPKGLLYTILLTPVFYYWLATQRERFVLSRFLLASLPFLVAHLLYNETIDLFRYGRSFVLVFTVYIFIYTFRVFLKRSTSLDYLFYKLLYYNFIFVCIALVLLFTPFWDWLWIDWWVSPSVGNLPRLALLTYEPSYYSTLLVPLFFFFGLKALAKPRGHELLQWGLVLLPLFLSFSMGVLASLFLSTVLVLLWQWCGRYIAKSWAQLSVVLLVLGSIGLLGLLVFYSNNPVFARIGDILSGNDSSGKGRTFQAFELAYLLAESQNLLFGVGFGQIKEVGALYFTQVFGYVEDMSIANTLGETLAHLGLLGLGLRLFFEIFLFFRTAVYQNYFRLLIFVYVFIYQFTGSFYTNIAEYVLWVLAFTNCFPQFDRHTYLRHQSLPSS